MNRDRLRHDALMVALGAMFTAVSYLLGLLLGKGIHNHFT